MPFRVSNGDFRRIFFRAVSRARAWASDMIDEIAARSARKFEFFRVRMAIYNHQLRIRQHLLSKVRKRARQAARLNDGLRKEIDNLESQNRFLTLQNEFMLDRIGREDQELREKHAKIRALIDQIKTDDDQEITSVLMEIKQLVATPRRRSTLEERSE